MTIRTKTTQDARDRMDMARMGSLADKPSLDYMYTLQSEIHDWLQSIEYQINIALQREAREKENAQR
jgi:hypothetical protein